MKQWIPIILLAASAAAAAEPVATCRLEIPPVAAEAPEGYRRAVLIVEHRLPAPVTAAALRAAEGGPWLLTRLTAPPGGPTRRAVRLPATSTDQTFTVRLFTEEVGKGAELPAPAAETSASIRWPVDTTDVAAWVDPTAQEIFGSAPAGWPVELRQQILIGLAGVVVLTGFALLAHRPAIRAATAAAIAVGAAAGVVWMLRAVGPKTESVRSLHLIRREAASRTRLETFTILTARRTGRMTVRLDAPARCLYADGAHMAADRAVIRRSASSLLSGTVLTTPMRSGEVRLLAAGGPAPAEMARPKVRLTAEDEYWALWSDRSIPPSVLVVGPRVVRVGAMARRTVRRAPRSTSESIHALYGSAERFGLDADSLRLLRYWDASHRKADRTYLVWSDPLPAGPALYAIEVEKD